MLKKIGLFCATTLLGAACWATTQTLAPINLGFQVDCDLPAQVARTFINPLLWTIKGKCTLYSEDSSNELEVLGISGNGSVNGIALNKGTQITLTVHSGDVLDLVAESGSKVQLTNSGPHNIKAHCVSHKL